MSKAETIHVTGSTQEEINESFNAAMAHYTPKGEKRPTRAVVERLRREANTAREAIAGQPGGQTVAASEEAVSGQTVAASEEAVSDGKVEGMTDTPETPAVTPEQEHKAEEPETAAPRSGGRPLVERHDECPECGFHFNKPQPRCQSRSACEKRKAARSTSAAA